jgi:hypothetical protein
MNRHGNPTWDEEISCICIKIDSDSVTELLEKFKTAGVNAESHKNFMRRDAKELTLIKIPIEEKQKAEEVYRLFTAGKE